MAAAVTVASSILRPREHRLRVPGARVADLLVPNQMPNLVETYGILVILSDSC